VFDRLRAITAGTFFTVGLAAAVVAAFGYATYLSYWGGMDVNNAFSYQSAVVAAQRDADLLSVEQYDRALPQTQLRIQEKLLDSDLALIDQFAENPAEKPPPFGFPATRLAYQQLDEELRTREDFGQQRFSAAVDSNVNTRNLSNALFAIVALSFTFLQHRLRRKIEQERDTVEKLQSSLVSYKELANVDIGKHLVSAEGAQIGGDIFDVYDVDGRHGSFLVADVSGKGLAAAVDTAFIKYAIRALLGDDLDPGEVLNRFSALYERNAQRNDSFVVLFLGVIDTRSGQVRYASAGHEPAWLRKNGHVETLPPTGPLIGVMPESMYESRTLQLDPGDTLVISTDGLTESRDARDRMLDAEGVRRWLEEVEASAQATADTIVNRLHKRSPTIEDDLALLVVRYDPKTPPPAAAEPALASGERR
jgi:serine phosphatase RsbU (regulator of sigma subunit)